MMRTMSCIRLGKQGKEIIGPWHEGVTDSTQRHSQGWSNEFAFPYEVGFFWNFTVGGVGQRAVGCPGLDEPFGTIDKPNWPLRNANSPIFASPAMHCSHNEYAPDGKPLYEIVDELASDNEVFAEKFLEGWQMMTQNGNEGLVDGPHHGWLGYHSLAEQGFEIEDFDAYIAKNSPLKFTDPKVIPTEINRSCIHFYSIHRWIPGSVDIEDMLRPLVDFVFQNTSNWHLKLTMAMDAYLRTATDKCKSRVQNFSL